MKRKFIVRDSETGGKIEVIEETSAKDEEEIFEDDFEEEIIEDDLSLTPEEISKVRTLLSKYDEILALLTPKTDSNEEEKIVEDEKGGEDIILGDDEECNEGKEKVLNHDSSILSSIGKNPSKTKTRDSDEDDSLIEAWKKRYAAN